MTGPTRIKGRADRAPGVALWLIFLFTAGTVAALVVREIFHWSL